MPKLSEVTGQRNLRLSDVQASEVGVPELLRRPEPMSVEQIRQFAEQDRKALTEQMLKQEYDALSMPEKLAVGFGRGVESLGEGLGQVLQFFGTGQPPRQSESNVVTPQAHEAEAELSRLINEAAQTESEYQRMTPDGTAAGLGRLLFNVASTAVPATKLSQVAKVPAIASPALRAGADGAIGGLVAGATTPVAEGGAEGYGGNLLSQLLSGATVGGVTGAGLDVAGQGIRTALSPRSTLINTMTAPQTPVSQAVFGVPDEEFVRRGAQLEREIGVDLSPAQKTGQKFTTALENAARQNAFTADRMAAKDAEIAQKATRYIDSIMDGVSKRSQTPESAGEAVQNALRNATKSMIEERRKVGNEMYGALRNTGVKIRYQNLADELQKIVDESEGALGKDAQAAAANARRMLNIISDDSAENIKPTALLDPDDVTPPHPVVNEQLVNDLGTAMEASGWRGRPLLAYKDWSGEIKLLTGSHRSAAADRAGIKIPAVMVSDEAAAFRDPRGILGDIDNVAGLGDEMVYDFLKLSGDKNAADLMRRELGSQAREFGVDAALKSRSEFSSGAAGTGQVFQDLESAAQRRYSARLRDALESDFAATEAGDQTGALRLANEAYRAHSQRIDQVKKTYLGKLLGQDLANDIDGLTMQTVAPEQVAAKLMRLQPSEARQLNAFLRKHDPEASDAMRRAILDNAYAKMLDRPISAGAEAPADIGAFVREIKKNKALAQWFSKEEMAKLGNVEELAKRLGDKFGYNFSGTAAQSSLLELIKPGVDRVAQLAILNKVANMKGSAPLPTPSLGRLADPAQAGRQAAAISAGAAAAESEEPGQQ